MIVEVETHVLLRALLDQLLQVPQVADLLAIDRQYLEIHERTIAVVDLLHKDIR